MKLTIKAESLKEPLKLIANLLYEANLRTTEEGLELICWDPAQAAAVVYRVSKTLFVEYLPAEEPIGVKIKTITESKHKKIGLNDLVKKAKPGDLITIEENKGLMTVIVNGRKYTMGVLNEVEGEQRIPNLTFNTVFNIETSKLADVVGDSYIESGESLLFDFKDGKLKMSTKDDSNNSMEEDKIQPTEVITGGDSKARYSVEYLRNMIGSISEKVRWSYGTDYPLRIDYVTPEFELSFILGPRVENT